MQPLLFLLLGLCGYVHSANRFNRGQIIRHLNRFPGNQIQALNSFVGSLKFHKVFSYFKEKKQILPIIEQLLQTENHSDLLLNILRVDLKFQNNWITINAHRTGKLLSILEYVVDNNRDPELYELIYPKLFFVLHETNRLQNLVKIASQKILGNIYYYAFQTKNKYALSLLKNGLSKDQINVLFQEILYSWDEPARLDVFRNLTKYFKTQNLVSYLSINGLVQIFEYNVQYDDKELDVLENLRNISSTAESTTDKLVEFMTLGMKVWAPNTINYFSQQVLNQWGMFSEKFKIEFFYYALSWNPFFYKEI